MSVLDNLRRRLGEKPVASGPTTTPAPGPEGCAAPRLQLHFKPGGQVVACSWSDEVLGSVGADRLVDIWRGERAAALRERLRAGTFAGGCADCGLQVEIEGRERSRAALFDPLAASVAPDSLGIWPTRFEFELSNACNLQCLQCTGEYSSAIRLHRERRSPLPRVYDDRFFEDVREFLPHLREATFAGGEPFLAAENFRMWDLMAELCPGAEVTVVTNGTQWNRRVEEAVERLRMRPIVSLDAVTSATYERIRGGDLEAVMGTLDRLCRTVERHGAPVQVNFCLMPQNHHELPDLLLFAEDRGIVVNIIMVRDPPHASLSHLPPGEVAAVLAGLERRDAEVQRSAPLNRARWEAELGRIRRWVATTEETGVAIGPGLRARILQFARQGNGPTDIDAVVSELAGAADEGVVERMVIGSSELVTDCSAQLAARFGLDRDEIVGHGPAVLLERVERWETLDETVDRFDAELVFPTGGARVAMVPVRDRRGWADEVVLLLAFRSSDPARP